MIAEGWSTLRPNACCPALFKISQCPMHLTLHKRRAMHHAFQGCEEMPCAPCHKGLHLLVMSSKTCCKKLNALQFCLGGSCSGSAVKHWDHGECPVALMQAEALQRPEPACQICTFRVGANAEIPVSMHKPTTLNDWGLAWTVVAIRDQAVGQSLSTLPQMQHNCLEGRCNLAAAPSLLIQ